MSVPKRRSSERSWDSEVRSKMGLSVWGNLKLSYSLHLKWPSWSLLSSICSPGGGAIWDAVVPLRGGVQLAEAHPGGRLFKVRSEFTACFSLYFLVFCDVKSLCRMLPLP